MTCTALGVLGAWMLFRDSGALGWRMFGGGAAGFVIGMYVVESVWERSLAAREPSGPIGPRR